MSLARGSRRCRVVWMVRVCRCEALALVAMLSHASTHIATAQEIEFAEEGLSMAVREALGSSDAEVTADDALTLTQFDATALGLVDIGGIEALGNLQVLLLGDNAIRDLSALSGLEHLVALDLSNNDIEDISHLAHLTELKQLNLEGNRIVDLTPIAGLDQLEVLVLNNNSITDLAPLLERAAVYVELSGNPLDEQAHLEEMPRLAELGFELLADPYVPPSPPEPPPVGVTRDDIRAEIAGTSAEWIAAAVPKPRHWRLTEIFFAGRTAILRAVTPVWDISTCGAVRTSTV